jgi:acetolactate synthase-1/2/3 large subunit
MQINGGEMIARVLEREGVKNVFALHGGHIDPIFQACYDHGIRIVDTRHEQAAGHMADAWGRLTGQPGVAIVTAGPGVTDIVTAVANAYMDCVPMVVIGGRYPAADDEMMPLQELHGVPLMQSITKWSRSVRDPKRIAEYVSDAFRQATTGRPGPVFLEVPADTLARKVEEENVRFPSAYRAEERPAPSPEAVEKALRILADAERPVIFAGRGVWFSGASDELREFCELTGIPACANGMTRGAVPEDTALGLGGMLGGAQALPFAGGADAVMLLGGRLGMFTGGRRSTVPVGAKMIQVDILAEEIGRSRDVDLGIVADCRETLRALIRGVKAKPLPRREEWLARLQQAKAGVRSVLDANINTQKTPMHPYHLAHMLGKHMQDGVLVADGGETFVWAELALTATRPGRYLGHGYLGCLGIGIPFGLAAALAHPNERVLVLTGDGSVGLNFSEFDTAVRHNLPVVVVVNNDQAWGMCKHEQELRFGKDRVIGTALPLTHYEKAAEAFGVHAEFVERHEDVIPAVERAFASGRPACVNVMTDPDAISPAVQAGALVEAGTG